MSTSLLAPRLFAPPPNVDAEHFAWDWVSCNFVDLVAFSYILDLHYDMALNVTYALIAETAPSASECVSPPTIDAPLMAITQPQSMAPCHARGFCSRLAPIPNCKTSPQGLVSDYILYHPISHNVAEASPWP